MTSKRIPTEVPTGLPVTRKEWDRLCAKSRQILIDFITELTELRAAEAARGRVTSGSEVEVRAKVGSSEEDG